MEIGMVCAGVLLSLIIGLDVLSDISGSWVGAVFGVAVALLFFGGAALGSFMYWRTFTARDFLRLDTERGVLLYGRWHWGWQAQQEYPLSMFAAVAVSEVRSVFRARRGGKTRQTVGRQPSEIKAALEAAQQQIEEERPNLPERAAPKTSGRMEFAVYSIVALLSRIPFLLLVLLILLGGFEFSQKWLFWLAVLLFAGWRLAYHWHTLHKVRYNMQEDALILYRLRRFKWQPEKHYALSAFCGIYCREKYSSMGAKAGEIWLAGKEGGNDVRLLKADFLLRDNRQAAVATAKQIARTTGLPLLEYVEPAERIV